MDLGTRGTLDRSLTYVGGFSIVLMTLFLIVILAPICVKGVGAFIFRGTVEFRKVNFDVWDRGDKARLAREVADTDAARRPVYEMMKRFKKQLRGFPRSERRRYGKEFKELGKRLRRLLGPFPGQRRPVLMRQRYGQTRWDGVERFLNEVLFVEEWDYSNEVGVKVLKPRMAFFKGTSLEKLFPYLKKNINAMMAPQLTFYPRFLTDASKDSHFFGGVWPELLGTIYLTLGAMFLAVPIGVLAAVYFCEYATQGPVVSFLRICISTLAGVPSIVFGLFGLAFFLNTLHVSDSKSVLVGAMTLSLLILPTIIRTSEEAILAVPHSYKEAALALGAGKWKTVATIILPASLPGILTGIIISMGRAAGETAPIIFTAAVSVGGALGIQQILDNPTPALSWNIYNLCTEHESVDQIRHVQYGMVLVLVGLVLALNLLAIILRARITKRMKA
ncbi:MAG: phosphate ABC transporter permease PstA [Kiritimatiellaeota bacterium]|nr:phosphate ABC transporter permease PstA [Kiritimatiellota bacterium]